MKKSQSATHKTTERKRQWISENISDCCVLCGYNKCQRALELHHTKETPFLIRKKGRQRSGLSSMPWQDIYDDAPHMVVLCSNCHREVHEGMHPEIPVPEHTTSGDRQKGRPPFGYKWQDGEIVVNPKTITHRKRMNELYKQGLGWSAIARKLNEEGIPTQTGIVSGWFPTTVMRVIEPRYSKVKR